MENTENSSFEKVKNILIDKLGLSSLDEINNETNLSELGADSLDIVEIVMECEKEFDVNIPDDIAENIQTVEDLCKAILRQ